jgi:hypothetical protein
VLTLVLALLLAQQAPAPNPTTRDFSHPSQVLGTTRTWRAILPASYAASQKRYPVVYWLFGYEQADDRREREIAEFTSAHDVIVVEAGPLETTGEFPLYFPELVSQADSKLRTLPDRDHRGVAGAALGGFLALWTAGKFPDLVASASSANPYAESAVGPADFPVESGLEDGAFNYDGVRTLPLAKTAAEMLAFHLAAFTTPQPKPSVWSHADGYPNFTVWGWEAESNRRRPGFTLLENVSSKGFRSSVREWVPGGATLPEVKFTLQSAPKTYLPGSAQTVIYIRLRDGRVRRATQKADPQGRLVFDLDGDAYEVGVSPEPIVTAAGYDLTDTAWATAGQPVNLKVKFWNKGGARSATTVIKWESATPGVHFSAAVSRVFALAPGESAAVPIAFTADAPGTVRIFAVEGAVRSPLDIPVFPAAAAPTLFQIADGTSPEVWQHGSQHVVTTLGDGNRDGHAAPGESVALLFPAGEYLRLSEIFTNDECVDTTVRAYDSLGDHASLKYTLPTIRPECDPGHVVHALAKVTAPNVPAKYYAVEFPVWYRTEK